MVALRCLYLTGLVCWVGGMVVLGALAAPATFDVLEANHGFAGRLEAGDVFGEMLHRFRYFEYGSATILLGCLGVLYRQTPRPPMIWVRVITVAVMFAVSLYSGLGITGQLAAVQLEIEANLATMTDPTQYAAQFDHLYSQTTALQLLNLAGGLSLIYWEARARIA